MKLDAYLKKEKIKPIDFAGRIGVSFQTVYKWMDGTRTPRNFIPAIAEATKGKVTANDFYLG